MIPAADFGPAIEWVEIVVARTIDKISGIEKTSEAFRAELVRVADRLGCDPSDLAAIISFESGRTFSPSVRNRSSGAVGLIQFTKSGIAGLGTTLESLANMSAVEQLAWVEKYFRARPKARNLGDLYMAVLWPSAVYKPDSFVLMTKESPAYKPNAPALDPQGLGYVTRAMALSPVRSVRNSGKMKGQISVNVNAESGGGPSALAMLGAGAAILFLANV